MFFSSDEKEPRQIITEDTPRKTGFARLVEVLVRDFGISGVQGYFSC